jgi:bifunctional non-homologous end joining protein LigD
MLEEYKKKRNFKKTPEPLGKKKAKKSQRLIFVVQEHYASHLHWDFRLEIDGVLKSWALPKGPPKKLGEKRLAVQVEDHPISYAKFHGVIPEGQYGAGKVIIWDSGYYELLRREPEIIEFILHGNRLKGNFVLFHPEKFESKSWLILKKKSD